MKKNPFLRWKRPLKNERFFHVLSLTFILMLHSVLGYGGETPQDTISLNLKEVKLEKFVEVMKQKTGWNFLYNSLLFKDAKLVSVVAKGENTEAVLKRVLEKEGFTYDVEDDIVVIKQIPGSDNKKTVDQRVIIKGKVVDPNKQPLPGVTLVIKGTNMGTATDVNGNFKLELTPSADTLIVTFVGMKTQYVPLVEGKTEYYIRMQEDMKALDAVVVTGYGNVAKRNYTGAVTTVKAEDILVAGARSIDQMLQGVVPGMLVQTRTGMVGATPKIRVRGTSTLLGSQEPVWVVDGIIQRDPQPFNSDNNTKFSMEADDISKLAGNAISWLNPHNIETITVLKDASATAIYGSQAANGVIVITTKKAQPGRLSVFYNGDLSIGQRPHYGLYDRMNSRQIMEYSKEMYEDRVSYPSVVLPLGYAGLVSKMINKEITPEEMSREYERMSRENTDWFKLLFRNSLNHSHSLSISGGSEKVMNRTSFSMDEEKGEAKGNDLSGFSVLSNTEIHLGECFTVNWSLNGNMRKVKGFAYGVDPFDYAYNTTRVLPAYNEDGTFYYHDKWGEGNYAIPNKNSYNYNIFNELSNTGSRNETKSWGTTVDVNLDLLPGLQYQGMFSYSSSLAETKTHATERSFYITQHRGYEFGTAAPNSKEELGAQIPKGGVLSMENTNVESVTTRNSLSYNEMFQDKHLVVFSAGIETNSTRTTGGTNLRYGYLKDRGETFALVPATVYMYGSLDSPVENREFAYGTTTVLNRKNNLLSGYVQGVYGYDERYILNVSARVDASNRFGQDKNKKFAPTWSVGVKWNVGNESFLQNATWFDVLDVTLSYGYQGNAVANVSPYLIAIDKGNSDYYGSYMLNIKSLPYPNLGWEKTKTYNLGLNASFLNGRLNANFSYYMKDSDVLSSRDLPRENGMDTGLVSGSKMRNSGYEFVVDVVPVKTDHFSWHLSVNSGVTKNEIRKNERINTLDDFLTGSAVVAGVPFSTFYSFEFKELDAQDGTPLFHKVDQEQVTSPLEYLVKSGKFTPDFSGGLNTMFKYKNWNLYALFSIQWGGSNRLPELYHTSYNNGVPTPEQNISRKLANRWRKPGDTSLIPSTPGVGKTSVRLPSEMSLSSFTNRNPYEMYNQSNIRVAKTDMIRCNNISLEYEFNPELLAKLFISRLSLKASMMNPFMWVSDKKWEGIDPETADWPARRMTSFSLQVAF